MVETRWPVLAHSPPVGAKDLAAEASLPPDPQNTESAPVPCVTLHLRRTKPRRSRTRQVSITQSASYDNDSDQKMGRTPDW